MFLGNKLCYSKKSYSSHDQTQLPFPSEFCKASWSHSLSGPRTSWTVMIPFCGVKVCFLKWLKNSFNLTVFRKFTVLWKKQEATNWQTHLPSHSLRANTLKGLKTHVVNSKMNDSRVKFHMNALSRSIAWPLAFHWRIGLWRRVCNWHPKHTGKQAGFGSNGSFLQPVSNHLPGGDNSPSHL